jgi:hypothetical protein
MSDTQQCFELLRIAIAELCTGAGDFESRILSAYHDRLRQLFKDDEVLGVHGELISAAIICEQHISEDGTKSLPFSDRDREFVCNALLAAMLHAHGLIAKAA